MLTSFGEGQEGRGTFSLESFVCYEHGYSDWGNACINSRYINIGSFVGEISAFSVGDDLTDC